MANSTVLVTGGAGFLGSHLVERLLSEGYLVVVVDNFCTGDRANLTHLRSLPRAAETLEVIEADVTTPWNSWLGRVQKFPIKSLSHIFHLASPASPPQYQRLGLETLWVNSLGLAHGLAFADSVGARLVFASTSEIYGNPTVTPQSETYWGNVNTVGPRCYDEAKRFGEALLHTHNLKHGTRHGLVRIFNTYGPRMNPNDGRVIINFLVQALRGETLTVYGDGLQTRSFCFVDDLIDGLLRFAQHANHPGPINLGNGDEFTILQLVEAVKKLFPDEDLALRHLEIPQDDPRQRRPSLELAHKVLDWEPSIPLREGLKRTLAWLKTQPLPKGSLDS